MDWTFDLTAASAALYAFGAGEAAFVRLRRARDVEYAVFGAMCGVLCAFAIVRAAAIRSSDSAALVAIDTLLACYAHAAFVDLALAISASPNRARWRTVAYALATLVGLGLAVRDAPPDQRGAVGLGMFSAGSGSLVPAAAAISIILAAFHLARAALAGRAGATSLCLGALVALVAAGHDLTVAVGLVRREPLAQIGFLAFLPAFGGYVAARYIDVAAELETKNQELAGTSRELLRSYEDLRVTQEELFRKEQLAVVGELAAVVAHEVRNPLAVIANAVAGLRKGTLSKDDQATLLGILDEEASRLNRLVSDLLRFARPVNVQRVPVDLADLLGRALKIAEDTAVEITRDIDLGEARVWADPSLLRQVFDNLVDNAVQAMGGEGSLSIRAKPREVDGLSGIAVEIRDTGEGMDTLVRQRARDPFFTTRPSGTGLGLAIVDRIVEAHGGHLLIESRPGEGTSVTVILPVGRPSEPPLRSRPPRSPLPPEGARSSAPPAPADEGRDVAEPVAARGGAAASVEGKEGEA